MLAELKKLDLYIPGEKQKVLNFVQRCDSCSAKSLSIGHVIKHPIVPSAPVQHFQLDCVSFTEATAGFIGISNVVDLFSKFAVCSRPPLTPSPPPFFMSASDRE